MSIFGNYKYKLVRKTFNYSQNICKADNLVNDEATNKGLFNKIKLMFKNLLDASLVTATQNKVNLVVHHASENTFSPGDLGKFMDTLKVEGINPKLVFIDYIDVMSPSVQRYKTGSDYDVHGQIVQELRTLSRNHKIPIITATQNTRSSENMSIALSNDAIGDSYKKVRFSDFIYMCRMRADLSPLKDPVLQHVADPNKHLNNGQLTQSIMQFEKMINENLVPFETKITKSKEGGRDATNFSLFCKDNLKIYNNLNEYLSDAKTLYPNSNRLECDIESLTDLAISSVTENFDNSDQQEQFDPTGMLDPSIMDFDSQAIPMDTGQTDDPPPFL